MINPQKGIDLMRNTSIINRILFAVTSFQHHDGPCGGHFADKRTTYKVLQYGYYWPTIFKDAKKYVASCDDFQRMGKPIAVDEMLL